MTTLQVYVTSPVQAHQTTTDLWKQQIHPHTKRGGHGVITWQTASTYMRLKHRGYFHGPLLAAISDQVWFRDEKTGLSFRYSKDVWKEYLKQQYLLPKFDESARDGKVDELLAAGLANLDSVLDTEERDQLTVVLQELAKMARRARKRRPSTEDLSDDEYSAFLQAVEAFALTELGVEIEDEDY